MAETFELITFKYDDPAKAGEVFKSVQSVREEDEQIALAAAAIMKDADGQTHIQGREVEDAQKKKGTRRGALAGAALAILLPPVGAAGLIVGTAAGAAVGRRVGKAHEEEVRFNQETLQKLIDEMEPGSSLLIGIVEKSQVKRVINTVYAYGGDFTRQELSPEAVEAMLGAAE